MKIKVEFTTEAGFDGSLITCAVERELGIIYRHASNYSGHYYEVIDKELFFLGVIKYGITYEAYLRKCPV